MVLRSEIMEYAVAMKGICKSFGGIQALKYVDLELRQGEIMGIVGDNGAGKSTLMKILSGAYQADEGEIYIFGKQPEIHNPLDSFKLGISMIYQDLALFNNLDVANNIFVGRELVWGPLGMTLNKKGMYRRAEELIKNLKNLGLSILLITQRIPDILAIADRVFVLKGGVRQEILNVKDATLDDVVTLIVKGKDGNIEIADDIEYQSFGSLLAL